MKELRMTAGRTFPSGMDGLVLSCLRDSRHLRSLPKAGDAGSESGMTVYDDTWPKRELRLTYSHPTTAAAPPVGAAALVVSVR